MRWFLLILGSVCCILASSLMAATYGGGSGTPDDPYQIWTPQQMNTIGLNEVDLDKCFILMDDIDMSAYTGTQYNIIGRRVKPAFSGLFDGNGHVIRNLSYTKTNYNPVDYVRAGLFGTVSNSGRVCNLGLQNVMFSCGQVLTVGGLAGENLGQISSCWVTGSVSGVADSIGGLVGSDFGRITHCYADCAVSGSASVNNYVNVGGLVGYAQYGVRDCFAAGSVSSAYKYARVGGLVGDNAGSLLACYATASVSSSGQYARVGGLVGNSGMSGSIKFCYAAGPISGTYYTGGLAGVGSSASVIACFWDVLTSGTTDGIGSLNPDPAGVVGCDTDSMKTLSTFAAAGWDFTNETANGTNDYWRMCAEGVDYPRLNWEAIEGDFACPDGVSTEDLDYYLARWLTSNCIPANNYCGGADINFSGRVDLADWTLFAGQWMEN